MANQHTARDDALANAFRFAGIKAGMTDLERHSRSFALASLEQVLAKAWRAELTPNRAKKLLTDEVREICIDAAAKGRAITAARMAVARVTRAAVIIEFLRDGPRSRPEIEIACAEACGLKETAFRAFLRDMCKAGTIQQSMISRSDKALTYEVAE